MANDLATLNAALTVQLSDPTHAAWASTEKDALITQAVNNLYPRFSRPDSVPIWPLEADRETYPVPGALVEIYRIELGEAATDMAIRVLDGGTWYTFDDPLTNSLQVFVNARYSDPDHYYIVHGFGRYDLSGNLIPDALVPAVLAFARAEAYRRQLGERARFLQWQASSQEQDTTINGLLALTQEAQGESERLRVRLPRTARRPVPGRLGR